MTAGGARPRFRTIKVAPRTCRPICGTLSVRQTDRMLDAGSAKAVRLRSRSGRSRSAPGKCHERHRRVARIDPEDMRAVIDAYHAACARITRTYDGFLAEFRGDGILAYFGYPIAHEDDAERTVRAGLEIIAAVARLETRAAEPLAVRIGIATGVVVVGELSREGALREHAVVGDTPNLAA